MKEIGQLEIKRILNSQPAFSPAKFKEADDKHVYITTLLMEMFIKYQIKNSTCNLTELTSILR